MQSAPALDPSQEYEDRRLEEHVTSRIFSVHAFVSLFKRKNGVTVEAESRESFNRALRPQWLKALSWLTATEQYAQILKQRTSRLNAGMMTAARVEGAALVSTAYCGRARGSVCMSA